MMSANVVRRAGERGMRCRTEAEIFIVLPVRAELWLGKSHPASPAHAGTGPLRYAATRERWFRKASPAKVRAKGRSAFASLPPRIAQGRGASLVVRFSACGLAAGGVVPQSYPTKSRQRAKPNR